MLKCVRALVVLLRVASPIRSRTSKLFVFSGSFNLPKQHHHELGLHRWGMAQKQQVTSHGTPPKQLLSPTPLHCLPDSYIITCCYSLPAACAGWRFLVNFLLPPPMILTFLLVLPFPRNVRKGLLLFTNQVLSFTVCECPVPCSRAAAMHAVQLPKGGTGWTACHKTLH